MLLDTSAFPIYKYQANSLKSKKGESCATENEKATFPEEAIQT